MGAVTRIRERRIEHRLQKEATNPRTRTALRPPDWPGVDSNDSRAGVPPLGLREYWYPALPVRHVGRRRPVYWRMLGEELCFFRGDDDRVAAVSDICPHRGASLSGGKCFYRGTVACPYHGAVFGADGKCRAFLTEGPDSKTPANLSVRTYPTVELRGWVFVWMGAGEPVDPALDIPPEMFEPESTMVLSDYTYWPMSWVVGIENQGDAHNSLYVHRNSVEQIVAERARKRSPMGPRSTVIEDRAVVARQTNARYYEKDGVVPFQMTYEGVGGKWPKTRWRKWIWTLFTPYSRWVVNGSLRRRLSSAYPYTSPEEWGGGGSGQGSRQAGCWHLPCAVRVNTGHWMHTRFAVPVAEDMSRVIYFNYRRTRWLPTRVVVRIWFHGWFKWVHFYNFSGKDALVASPCRYWAPENLTPTDSHLLRLRRLITEGSRDALRRKAGSDARAAGGPGAEPGGNGHGSLHDGLAGLDGDGVEGLDGGVPGRPEETPLPPGRP